jgi:hypothetical protein
MRASAAGAAPEQFLADDEPPVRSHKEDVTSSESIAGGLIGRATATNTALPLREICKFPLAPGPGSSALCGGVSSERWWGGGGVTTSSAPPKRP